MEIDYLTIMLINLGAGLAMLAHYLYMAPQEGHRRGWAAGFFAVGLLGIMTALPMVLTWPLPGSYNIAYGEGALYLSITFIAAAITLAFEWEPMIPAIFGLFGSIYAIVIGARVADLHMSSAPTVAALGYFLTGIGGVLTLPAIRFRTHRSLAIIAAVVLGLAALIWLFTGYAAVWAHLLDFKKYVPPTMAKPQG